MYVEGGRRGRARCEGMGAQHGDAKTAGVPFSSERIEGRQPGLSCAVVAVRKPEFYFAHHVEAAVGGGKVNGRASAIVLRHKIGIHSHDLGHLRRHREEWQSVQHL